MNEPKLSQYNHKLSKVLNENHGISMLEQKLEYFFNKKPTSTTVACYYFVDGYRR